MALLSDAAMVLFYDIQGDVADHDDWHSVEHFHERLSVPGFLRATRWVSTGGGPRYFVIYDVTDTGVAESAGYLDRLNNPTAWTQRMMPRFRGMTRGFCRITASCGFGFGSAAAVLRFAPEEGAEARMTQWLSRSVLPAMAARRGMVGAHLLQPGPRPPMTREQSLRGADDPMPWLVFTTGYDAAALDLCAAEHLTPERLRDHGAAAAIRSGSYRLHYTATGDEAARNRPRAATAD
ncbi:hypothetical protein QO034_16050 [Sedimentitalea sp. JM2-8]|uniref:Uncharacterized protein n=1 Tax=Sedimentitalea xiamensis TaxID=3050037 RepID=A0ABT7FHJ7_9RHOB|nr:hypothetical protein [Sedimentitalea xiamensis]MDK3074606.1 hypothetical protein [Sedimentitalea xiamensis]